MKTSQQIETFFIRFLYCVGRTLAAPLLVFYFVYRCARDRRYFRHFSERLGGAPSSFQATAPGAIWLHAVSVGEVISAVGLIQELRAQKPRIPIYVSVTTVAGREVAEQKLADIVNGIFYAPLDYAFAVRRVMRRLRPFAVVILETEIWPVLYREAKRSGASLLVLNGRISDRAYPRYWRWRFFFQHALSLPDVIFTQSEQDRHRYVEIGAPEKKAAVLGNLKYDAAPLRASPPKPILDLLDQLRPTAVWIAASTMAGVDANDIDEDQVVVNTYQELIHKNLQLLLILVPRKPERFDSAEQLLRSAGLRYVRRSQLSAGEAIELPCVLLLDSMGELASLFPLADIVFMGGTLARRGGHNLLEPAASARPIIAGPHLENFAAIAAEFRKNQAMLEIGNAVELSRAVERLLTDPALGRELGMRAATVAAQHRGITSKAVTQIIRSYDRALPRNPRGVLAAPLLWSLSKLWTAGSNRRVRRDSAAAQRLDIPVISIGGLSMGGSGKTPLVDHLAARLRETGHQPAILTRGYGRRSIAKSIVLRAGEQVPVDITGDEAQIFLHSGNAHIGIGADRWATGRLLATEYRPSVFLLDDGFQHRRLIRDLDIVLIDALDPLARGAVFPLGNLREPWSALSRAHAFIITRAAPDREYKGLQDLLRSANPSAPIFHASVEPHYWADYVTADRVQTLPDRKIGAFCGLANPASFWTTLEALNIAPAFQWAFGDHHRYTCQQFKRLIESACLYGAAVLVTTEKDAINLPPGVADLLLKNKLELYWLKIGVKIKNELELLALIESKTHKFATR